MDGGFYARGVQSLTGVGDVHRGGGQGHGFLESAPGDGWHTAGIPHFPAALGNIFHDAHLGKATARAQRDVISEGASVAHGRGDDHGGSVKKGILELSRALARASGQVDVDKGRLIGDLAVTICR